MSIRVFLSSTFFDLKDERLEILHIFRRLRVVDGIDVDLITMEDFGFSPKDAKRLSLDKLNGCQAYLGLLSGRYGEIPQGERFSYSHLEYKQAVKNRVPIF